MSVKNQTKTPEIKEIERLIIERAIKEVINNPEKYWESIVYRVSAIKAVGITETVSGKLDEIINQGWSIDELEITGIDEAYYGISVDVKAPNGAIASIDAFTKAPNEMSKEEYLKFREIYDSIISKVKIALLEKDKKKLKERIKELEKEIEKLKKDKVEIERYYEEKKKEYDVVYEDARNMLEFINEKGLIDEYLVWLREKEIDKIKENMLNYYGIYEDYDC